MNERVEQALSNAQGELLTNRMSRRRFILRAAEIGLTGTAALAVLDACGFSSNQSSGAKTTQTLNYWGTPVLVPGTDWGPLTSDTGIKISFTDNGSAVGPVVAALSTGAGNQYDITTLNEGAQNLLAPAGYIVPVDPSRIPNASKAFDYWPLNNSDLFKYKGVLYGIPTIGNGDSIGYLPDRTGGVIDSLGALFDPAFKGHVALENRLTAPLTKTALYLKGSKQASIVDAGNLDLAELKIVQDFLVEKKKAGQFRTFWSMYDDIVTLFKNEEVWVADCWEPVVVAVKAMGKNIEYARPKEGYMFWLDANFLLKGGKDRGKEQAFYDLCNWQYGGWYDDQIAVLRNYLRPTPLGVDYATAHPKEFDATKLTATQADDRVKFTQFAGAFEPMAPTYLTEYEQAWQTVLNA